jgi:hypothetical protein
MTQAPDKSETAATDMVRMNCLKATLDFERESASRMDVPDVDNLPQSRSREKFEIIAALLLSLGVAGISLLGNFLIFNNVLHWTF